ncbi:MAG: hypothetical protein K6E47_03335 [Lachnospiraceae bacterium]|nr:hypothetical protein [Lachnospiraceae bacterium]
MRKLLLILIAVFTAGMLSACSSDYIELSEDDTNAIAQYCAHLLLKHDSKKVAERKLLDKDELEDYYKSLNPEEEDPTPTSELQPTPTPVNNTVTPEPTASPEPTAEVTPEPDLNKAESLTELFGMEGFTIEYKSCSISKTYSEDENFTITAKEGESILAFEFAIRNVGDKAKNFVSSGSKVAYALYCTNGDIYAPQISMLGNDIQFLNDEIDSDEIYTAVLLFITDEKDKPEKLRLEDGETGAIYDITVSG